MEVPQPRVPRQSRSTDREIWGFISHPVERDPLRLPPLVTLFLVVKDSKRILKLSRILSAYLARGAFCRCGTIKDRKRQVCAVYCSNWDAVKWGCLVIELDG